MSAPLQNTYFGETVWLFCVLLLLTMLGRAAFVFPFSFLHNWWACNEQLTFKEMIVIWCASSYCCISSDQILHIKGNLACFSASGFRKNPGELASLA